MLNQKVEVGGDIVSYCGKCKADSEHIVSAMEGDKLSKVTCRTCNAQHNYRKPKSLIAEEKAAKVAAKTTKAKSPRKSAKKGIIPWTEFIVDYDLNSAQAYNMRQNYEDNSLINHPSFGVGVVLQKTAPCKAEIRFELGVKLLVVNKK